MEKLLFIIVFYFLFFVGVKVEAQTTSKSLLSQPGISKIEIVGIWQFATQVIGDNLSENFQFFKDGTFIYNYNPEDDTRNIVQLRGKYRMDKNMLFFIVNSRKERIGGGLATGAIGTDYSIFTFDNDSTRVVHYKNKKELDPVLILDVKKTSEYFKIKINNRIYYKLSSNPNKF